MKMFEAHKQLLTIAAGAMLALGIATHASASPVFQVTPSGAGIGGPATPFNADFISGNSSTLLTTNADGTGHTGVGWLQFASFKDGADNIGPLITGLGINYNFFISFTLSDVLSSGTINGVNSRNTLTSLEFMVYADPGINNSFVAASAAGSGTSPSYTGGADDVLLGTGSLIAGLSGFNSLGGAYVNGLTSFELTPLGSTFFTNPIPFYNIAFNEFNNTGSSLQQNGNLISVNNATGGVDFNKVPEPASLALIGLGILAFAGVGRRRRS